MLYYQNLKYYCNLYVVIFEGFLKQKHFLSRVLRLCRRITDGDHLRWKYVVLENSSKNVALDGIICIYVHSIIQNGTDSITLIPVYRL